MSVRLLTGDSLDMLATLEAASVGACVTDPPYGLVEPRSGMRGMQPRTDGQKAARRGGFMGKAWDANVPGVEYWQAVHRVLKPGAWLLAFGGTRTYHRLTCAIEDADFEIRDCLMWLYGSGFPKGKGCLKPGWEPIVLARKKGPLWLNVDGCRIAAASGDYDHPGNDLAHRDDETQWRIQKRKVEPHTAGRWPANVVLSHEPECREVGARDIQTGNGGRGIARRETSGYMGNLGDREVVPYSTNGTETVADFECVESCAVRMLDAQSGDLAPGRFPATRNTSSTFQRNPQGETGLSRSTGRGGASRFFYCSKASIAERGQGNDHPTVKPLALMDWLVRLVTPPGETGIDPFCGSGSTLLAWDRLGFNCVGIDADPHAIEIAQRRLQADAGIFAQIVAS